MPSSSATRQRPPPIVTFSLPYLIFPAVLLALLTLVTVFIHSDVNAALLWSQCHSHAKMPFLTRYAPLPSFITTPLCSLASFFEAALASTTSTAALAVVLAFVGGLLTVHTVEAARICNAPNVLIAYPTGAWVLFNLLGGAFVWELVIIPAFLHRAKRILHGKRAGSREETGSPEDSHDVDESRHLPDSEVVAIPAAVALGFYLPTILMLTLKTPAIILAWLFFPIFVSLLRQLLRFAIRRLRRSDQALIHIESGRRSLVAVYTVPVLFSVLCHAIAAWANATRGHGDQRELTRSVIKFVEIDGFFIWLTVLYWMFVEVGWRVPLVAVVTSVVVGPGAGTCLSWVYRERLIHKGLWLEHRPRGESEEEAISEETPLLA